LKRLRLFERIKHAERDFSFGPEFGRIAEYVEQGFARFLVKFLRIRQLIQNSNKTRLRSGAGNDLGKTAAQRVEILAALFGKKELLADAGANLLFGQRIRAQGIEKVMTHAHRLLLQLRCTVSADGLHKIRRYSHQQTHFFLKSPSLVLLLQRAAVCGSGGLVRFLLVSFPRANKP